MDTGTPATTGEKAPPQVYHVRVQVLASYDYWVTAPSTEHAAVIAAYHAKLDARSGKRLDIIPTIIEE